MPFPADLLAPLQTVMLRDSLANPAAGVHVEQVVIVFTDEIAGQSVAAAWQAVVARTEVLQMAFSLAAGEPFTWRKVPEWGILECDAPVPLSWKKWLAEDRGRPLLMPDAVPWRAAYWSSERRFVWTFHHALLDGRSIARIVRVFLECLFEGIPPEPLAIPQWSGPGEGMSAEAKNFFHEEFAELEPLESLPPPETNFSPKAVRCLGSDLARRLEYSACSMGVSAATVLIWAWGQAVIQASGADFAIVEQVRCGPPQAGRAGFSMNTLPMVIHRANADSLQAQLQLFRSRLLALREFESFAPDDLPPEVIRMTNGPWSSVVMTERGTLAHMAGAGKKVESVTLREWPGESPSAAAYLLPDLRLEVEGSGNQMMLARWAAGLEKLAGPAGG